MMVKSRMERIKQLARALKMIPTNKVDVVHRSGWWLIGCVEGDQPLLVREAEEALQVSGRRSSVLKKSCSGGKNKMTPKKVRALLEASLSMPINEGRRAISRADSLLAYYEDTVTQDQMSLEKREQMGEVDAALEELEEASYVLCGRLRKLYGLPEEFLHLPEKCKVCQLLKSALTNAYTVGVKDGSVDGSVG